MNCLFSVSLADIINRPPKIIKSYISVYCPNMSTRSRRASASPSSGGNLASPSPSSQEETDSNRLPRQTRQASVRVTRGSSGAGSSTRISASRSGRSRTAVTSSAGSRSHRSARTRRPTPIVRRGSTRAATKSPRQQQQEPDDSSQQSTVLTDEELDQLDGLGSYKSSVSKRNGSGYRPRNRVTINTSRTEELGPKGNQLSWYERMMPECLLTMTSPITGYEARLDSDVDESEYDILERQRQKRNKRVRRRLITLILIAAAASAFAYSQGHLFRRMGVRATMTDLTHRLETGLAKSVKKLGK